jgi:predicted metalloprotease with PDZ domain
MRGPAALGRREIALGGAALWLAGRAAAQPPTGTIALLVDATDISHGILSVTQEIPLAAPGAVKLLYPQWIPGTHGPTGAVNALAGLEVTAGGQALPWRRDTVEMHAFHVSPPPGTPALTLRFQYVSPRTGAEGPVSISSNMLMLAWNTVLLYPAGVPVAAQSVQASLTLPEGWQYATALRPAAQNGATVSFQLVNLTMLVDSPLLAGRYLHREVLTEGEHPVVLHIAAEESLQLTTKDDQIAAHKRLVEQADRLFGARHFAHYDFLLGLSDRLAHSGLEHHQSSENITFPGYFTEWGRTAPGRDLLAHEFTHSWNGKFRRPAGHDRADFNSPFDDRLLWVYEGLTQYWGWVLAARSGLWSAEMARDAIAAAAGAMALRRGRSWRSLDDTTLAPVVRYRRPEPWPSWQRSEDYYLDGALLWLDVDTRLRQSGKASLDDFAQGFFGGASGETGPAFYSFEQVMAALGQVMPADWSGFFTAALTRTGGDAPLAGLVQAGYRLDYAEKASAYFTGWETLSKRTELSASIGLSIEEGGAIGSVLWEGPAFAAGLARGMQLVAVNGMAWNAERLKAAITAAKREDAPPIELLVREGDRYRTAEVAWRGGLRYPVLHRDEAVPPLLDGILAAR